LPELKTAPFTGNKTWGADLRKSGENFRRQQKECGSNPLHPANKKVLFKKLSVLES